MSDAATVPSAPGAPPAIVPTSGKAIGSLIFGLLALLCVLPLIGSVIGIVLGHLGLRDIKRGIASGRGLATAGLVISYVSLVTMVFGVALMAAMLLPALSQARMKARIVNDSSNLKQLGLGLIMYSGDNKGAFPDDLAVLAETGYMDPGKVYICPNTETEAPATAADIRAGRCDYVYLGKGLTDDLDNATSTVIAHTKPGAFQNGWVNYLFADGHVQGAKGDDPAMVAAENGWQYGPAPNKEP